MLKRFLFLGILVVLLFSANAQQPLLRNFNTRNGLPGNEIYFLLSDSKGYIWICSDAGLVKYNGNRFVQFSSANGLPDNTIFEVKEDKWQRIWFRSFSGKMGYILNDTVHVIGANAKIEAFINNGIISSFAIDEKGVLYLGKQNTDDLSFLKIDPPYYAQNVAEIWKRKIEGAGIDLVLIGGNDFVFSDSRQPNSSSYRINVYNSKRELLIENVIYPVKNSLFTRVSRCNNRIYLVANEELCQLDVKKKTWSSRQFRKALVTAVETGDNTLLAGELKQGVYELNLKGDTLMHLLEGLTFTHAVKDYQGGYWYATLEAGVFYRSRQPVTSLDYEENASVSELLCTGDSLYIGYNNGTVLLSFIGKAGMESKEICREAGIGSATTLVFPEPGELIVSGSLESRRINIPAKKNVPVFMRDGLASTFKKVIAYNKGIIGMRLGEICIYSPGNYTGEPKVFKSDDRLTAVAFDKTNNRILLGGLRGLYDFHFQEKITQRDRILEGRVEDVKAVNGVWYIATRASGLLVKKGNRCDTINEKKGLISDICSAVSVYGNTAWVSTNKGISRIVFRGGSYYVYNYPLQVFLDAVSVSRVCQLNNKCCFFSGSKIYFFDTLFIPGKMLFDLRSFSANRQPLPLHAFTELNYDKKEIRISYEALFYDCDKIQYRYKLNKKDSAWICTDETVVTFPKLASGEYEFILQARNRSGDWIDAATRLSFRIDKPFWLRGWFILLEIVLAVLTAFWLIRTRYKRILEKEREANEGKMRLYELQTRAVKAQMDPHFIFNSLNSIQHFILSGDTDNAYKYLSTFSKLVRRLLETNVSDSIQLSEEIAILKGYMEMEELRFEDAFTYELQTDPKLNVQMTRIPHLLIQPFVENAIWHGLLHKTGSKHLRVSFDALDQYRIVCTVEDNGVGRPAGTGKVPGGNKRSLGLELIRQRLDLIARARNLACGFEFTDKKDLSDNSAGTTVKIIIPILDH